MWSMKEFARLGAQMRLEELAAEMRAIHEAFPDLKRQAPGAKGNGRRKMTAAQKKLISEKMRAAWARRKSKEKR
jgi:hypothetical protein